MRALAVVAAAAVASAQTYWWKYAGGDITGNFVDIKHMSGDVSTLQTACAADSTCIGFNTDGWLKNCSPASSGQCQQVTGQTCDLYLKKSTPQPPAPTPPAVSLWPIPVSMTYGSTNVTVDAKAFQFVATSPSNDLNNAFTRFAQSIFQHNLPAAYGGVASTVKRASNVASHSTAAAMNQLVVTVTNTDVPLQLGVDESYTLTIPADGSPATLTAATVYGAYHGLTTFAQLVQFDFMSKSYVVNKAPYTITDKPKFQWRGLLIDTDRHFLPLATIFKIIDSVTMTKMNTIHWHIVDWQSWPLESEAFPLLWSAAWSSTEKYTFEDVAAVVEYARQRGVRVVPEFDTPGHAGSMCTGYPSICPSPTCTMPLNPATPNNFTFTVINAVISEIAAITPDTYFHLGGDEVDTSCWTNTPAIVDWMNAHGLTADTTYEYMVAAVDAYALSIGKYPIRWEEVWKHFGTQLDKNTIIHAWLSSGAVINATSNGYRAIWSVDGIYYLDALGEVWTSFYDADPLQGITNPAQQALMLGGEVEMWGETADPSDVMATIWPRAAAAAERWWSYDVVTNSSAPDVPFRFADFRCWMHTQGIGSAPINNAQARTGPPGPGSCRGQ